MIKPVKRRDLGWPELSVALIALVPLSYFMLFFVGLAGHIIFARVPDSQILDSAHALLVRALLSLGYLAPVFSIIAGIIGLIQTRRNASSGTGLCITSIVCSAGWLALILLMTA